MDGQESKTCYQIPEKQNLDPQLQAINITLGSFAKSSSNGLHLVKSPSQKNLMSKILHLMFLLWKGQIENLLYIFAHNSLFTAIVELSLHRLPRLHPRRRSPWNSPSISTTVVAVHCLYASSLTPPCQIYHRQPPYSLFAFTILTFCHHHLRSETDNLGSNISHLKSMLSPSSSQDALLFRQ